MSEIKVGNTYTLRDGETVEIIAINDSLLECKKPDGLTFSISNSGYFLASQEENIWDIMELIADEEPIKKARKKKRKKPVEEQSLEKDKTVPIRDLADLKTAGFDAEDIIAFSKEGLI